jgi:hypothetical protein
MSIARSLQNASGLPGRRRARLNRVHITVVILLTVVIHYSLYAGLRGVATKRKDAPYRSGTRSVWIKVKTALSYLRWHGSSRGVLRNASPFRMRAAKSPHPLYSSA